MAMTGLVQRGTIAALRTNEKSKSGKGVINL